ncbi:MAG TPA: hypothetical protein VJ876_04365 [Bacteroidales bacterium]|nr:hypothetical protein [Bacteroidales bacterium]
MKNYLPDWNQSGRCYLETIYITHPQGIYSLAGFYSQGWIGIFAVLL